jgi:hypothetical protein
MFRIRPPVVAVAAGESVEIKLIFNAGKTIPEGGKHYFAVYHIKMDDEKKTARDTWAAFKGQSGGTKKLFVDFKKEADTKENNNVVVKEEVKVDKVDVKVRLLSKEKFAPKKILGKN